MVEVSECDFVEGGKSDESEDDRVDPGPSRRVGVAEAGDGATEAGERVIRSMVSRKEGKSWASRRGSPVI